MFFFCFFFHQREKCCYHPGQETENLPDVKSRRSGTCLIVYTPSFCAVGLRLVASHHKCKSRHQSNPTFFSHCGGSGYPAGLCLSHSRRVWLLVDISSAATQTPPAPRAGDSEPSQVCFIGGWDLFRTTDLLCYLYFVELHCFQVDPSIALPLPPGSAPL